MHYLKFKGEHQETIELPFLETRVAEGRGLGVDKRVFHNLFIFP